LTPLMLAPDIQRWIFVVCWDVAVSIQMEESFQALKMLLPTGSMAIPYKPNVWESLFSVIAQSRVMPCLLQFILIPLPVDGLVVTIKVKFRHQRVSVEVTHTTINRSFLPLDPLGELLIWRVGVRNE
jgi:hypothetical protein